MGKESRKKQYDQIDEHDAPTEPLRDIRPMFFPAPDDSNSIRGGRTTVGPFSPYPNPQQPLPAYPYTQDYSPNAGTQNYYPFLPGTPAGTGYGTWPSVAAWSPENAKAQHTRRRRFLPVCVGLFFVCIQLLLVVRFVILFVSIPPDNTWVSVVTQVSEIFVMPFRELWFQIPSIGTLLPANIELYTLAAVLIYGVLSRLLVGTLKLILKSR